MLMCVCVCVCVCAGLPAHAADVRVNDFIVEVEGIDVRHSSGKQIVNLIRYHCINVLIEQCIIMLSTRRCSTTLNMILRRYETNSNLTRSQSIGNGISPYMSSLSLSPTFTSSQVDCIPKGDARRRLSNVEQISDRKSGSSLSLGLPTGVGHLRRLSTSPEPLMHQFSSSSNERSDDNSDSQPLQFAAEDVNHNSLFRPSSTKINGHLSQEHYHQLDHKKFLSMSTTGMAGHSPSQPVNLSYQHHHSSDHIDGRNLTFKGRGMHKLSSTDSNLFAQNFNVQLLSSKKLPSTDVGPDVKWEVRGEIICLHLITYIFAVEFEPSREATAKGL